jgi:LPXTG-motif cell wall-anchored protein
MKTRAIFAVAVALTASLAIAPSASAASTGTTPVGSTITATAWERGGLDDFSYIGYMAEQVRPIGGFEEYVYRIHSSGGSVDVQTASGYDSLTEAEQAEWYVDAGYAPYDFTWIAFTCLAPFDAKSDEVLVDEGISLTEMHYAAADELYPSTGRNMTDYSMGLEYDYNNGSLFDVDNFSRNLLSTTGYVSEWVSNGSSSLSTEMLFSVSYPEFACPEESDLEAFRIRDSSNPSSFATARDLVISDQFVVDAYGTNRTLAAEGVFVGVSGFIVNYEFNAALWGMTKVDGKLAATGTDASGLGLLGAGLAAVGIATLVLRRARQHT